MILGNPKILNKWNTTYFVTNLVQYLIYHMSSENVTESAVAKIHIQ